MDLGMSLVISYPNGIKTIKRSTSINECDEVFTNEPSKICGRRPLKSFIWSILEYFVLTLFFPMFPFDPPENIRKTLVF